MRSSLLRAWSVVVLCAPIVALSAQSEPAAVRPTHTPPAQPAEDTTVVQQAAPQRPNCWRAQPMPPCSGFFLTDFGVELPLLSTKTGDGTLGRPPRRDFRPRVVWTFGFMGTEGRHSHGGAISVVSEEADNGRLPYVLEYRYRNWLGRSAALDAALGFKASDVWENGTGLVAGRGGTAMIAFTPNRYIGASLRADVVKGGGRMHRSLMAGIQSTRLSEEALKWTAVMIVRGALAAIGLETEEN